MVDDAQSADLASLRSLAFLLRRREGLPVALLLGVRTGQVGGGDALLDEMHSDPGVRVVIRRRRAAPESPS